MRWQWSVRKATAPTTSHPFSPDPASVRAPAGTATRVTRTTTTDDPTIFYPDPRKIRPAAKVTLMTMTIMWAIRRMKRMLTNIWPIRYFAELYPRQQYIPSTPTLPTNVRKEWSPEAYNTTRTHYSIDPLHIYIYVLPLGINCARIRRSGFLIRPQFDTFFHTSVHSHRDAVAHIARLRVNDKSRRVCFFSAPPTPLCPISGITAEAMRQHPMKYYTRTMDDDGKSFAQILYIAVVRDVMPLGSRADAYVIGDMCVVTTTMKITKSTNDARIKYMRSLRRLWCKVVLRGPHPKKAPHTV